MSLPLNTANSKEDVENLEKSYKQEDGVARF